MLSKMLFAGAAVCAGVMGQTDSITAGTPVSAYATPTPSTSTLLDINPDPLLNVIFNYYNNLFNQPDIQALVQSLTVAAQTDGINYVAAQPSLVLAELPGLLSMFNPIFAAETDFYPKLLASETSIAAQITSFAAADQADPNKLVGDLINYVGGLMAEPTFTSFLNSLVTLLPTAAGSYLAASPSLILIDQLPAILTAANPVFTSEPFYPSLLALETQVQAAMTSIVSNYDATKWATVTGTATVNTQVLTTTLASGVLGGGSGTGMGYGTVAGSTTRGVPSGVAGGSGTVSGMASASGTGGMSTISIATFKGAAAPTGGLKAMAAVGGMVLGVAAML